MKITRLTTSGEVFNAAISPDGKELALSRGAVNRDVVLIKDFR